MNVRDAMIRFGAVVVLSHAAAIAQVATTPVGTWKSSTIMNREWNVPLTLELTISSVEADQRANGRFVLFFPSGGGFPSYCRNGPVAGQFDGAQLKVASAASNLCTPRLFDLKFSGDTMAGIYIGADGIPTEVTFTRHR